MTSNKLLATTCSVPQNGYNFLILFFHAETNLKVLLAQLRIDPCPLGLWWSNGQGRDAQSLRSENRFPTCARSPLN